MKIFRLIFIVLFIFSCKKNQNFDGPKTKVVQVEIIKKEYFFGKAKFGDTIKHTFLIKNVSDSLYKINKVGTSCGCTTVNFSKNKIERNDYAKIEVVYVPSLDENNLVSKSIVVSDNSDMGYNTLYIKGEIVN